MPFPRLHLFRFKRARAAVSQVEFLYATIRPNGKVRGPILTYTPNVRPSDQLVRWRVEAP